MNFNITFQFGFLCKNSCITVFKCYISILDTNNIVLDACYTHGVHFNSGTTFNNIIYFNLGPLKHIISTGHQIMLITSYSFTTSNAGGYVMDSIFTIERNPL